MFGVEVWMEVGRPCPPVRNDSVTPRHLFSAIREHRMTGKQLVTWALAILRPLNLMFKAISQILREVGDPLNRALP